MSMKKTITVHMIVKNEDKYIWFAIMSVIDSVDKLLIYDTGSIDKTCEIIYSIINSCDEYKQKIIFEKKGAVSREKFAKLRQDQIERTNTDFFFVLDGDEIWWKAGIEEMISIINSDDNIMLVAQKFYNCAGDIYHFRNEKRDVYHIENEHCAITIRLYSMKIPGIHCAGYYGIEGYFDINNNEVQNNVYKTVIMQEKYLHTTLLRRSSKRQDDIKVFSRFKKLFCAYDYAFPPTFLFPEVFYANFPSLVESPFIIKKGVIRSIIFFLLDILKIRRIIDLFRKKNKGE